MLALLCRHVLRRAVYLWLVEGVFIWPVSFRVIEYVPLDFLVLVWFVRGIDFLVLVGSDLHTLADISLFVCGCVCVIGDVCFLRICCD